MCAPIRRVSKAREPRGVGRPPAGVRPGERVKDYQRLSVRLPDDVRAELKAAAAALQRPEWRVLADALRAYTGSGSTLTEDQRRVVRAVLKLHDK